MILSPQEVLVDHRELPGQHATVVHVAIGATPPGDETAAAREHERQADTQQKDGGKRNTW